MDKSMNSRDLQVFGKLANLRSEHREPIWAWWMDCLASCCAIHRMAIAPRTAKTDGETNGARQWEARSISFCRRSAFTSYCATSGCGKYTQVFEQEQTEATEEEEK
jgi:hypothetical protein